MDRTPPRRKPAAVATCANFGSRGQLPEWTQSAPDGTEKGRAVAPPSVRLVAYEFRYSPASSSRP